MSELKSGRRAASAGIGAIDLRDIDDGDPAALVAPDRGVDGIAAAECELANEVGGHVGVAGLGEVAGGARRI